MSVELRPFGVRCNLQCHYCYQNPQRDADNVARSYDVKKMQEAVLREGGPFTLFGGEPLLTRKADLEELFRWGYERFGGSGLQTNGSLITDHHLRLFKRYNVRVGISLDGPGELNDVRWAGSEARTRETTTRSQRALERLCQSGVRPSLIVTLHRQNAVRDRLPILYDWIRSLAAMGVRSIRLHLLEVESEAVRRQYGLSVEENLEALLGFASLERELPTVQFDLFRDILRMLAGLDHNTTCVWNACDPYTTRAVRGVEGDGQRTNCGRTNKEGIDFVKAAEPGYERYLALYHTPQEHGGCRDCRFFLFCKGQCPGTAIDQDWRNRTEHCEIWKTLFARAEAEMMKRGWRPLSRHPLRRSLEALFLDAWAAGENLSIAATLRQLSSRAAS
jgi:uncharacterized protein